MVSVHFSFLIFTHYIQRKELNKQLEILQSSAEYFQDGDLNIILMKNENNNNSPGSIRSTTRKTFSRIADEIVFYQTCPQVYCKTFYRAFQLLFALLIALHRFPVCEINWGLTDKCEKMQQANEAAQFSGNLIRQLPEGQNIFI